MTAITTAGKQVSRATSRMKTTASYSVQHMQSHHGSALSEMFLIYNR